MTPISTGVWKQFEKWFYGLNLYDNRAEAAELE